MAHAHCMLDIKGYIHTHSEYVLLTTFFHCNNGCMNTPQCYIVCIARLPVSCEDIRQQVSFICLYISTRLHGVTS